MTYKHAGDQPVYAPNSFGGPEAAGPEIGADLGWGVEAGELARYAYEKHAEDDDFVQPRTLYNQVMGDDNREALVDGIVGHACAPEVTESMKERVVAYWANVDRTWARRSRPGSARPTARAPTAPARPRPRPPSCWPSAPTEPESGTAASIGSAAVADRAPRTASYEADPEQVGRVCCSTRAASTRA